MTLKKAKEVISWLTKKSNAMAFGELARSYLIREIKEAYEILDQKGAIMAKVKKKKPVKSC